jgi:hypothetical protein
MELISKEKNTFNHVTMPKHAFKAKFCHDSLLWLYNPQVFEDVVAYLV